MLSPLGIALVLPAIFRLQSPADDAVHRPLVVNGRTIPFEEIQRELLYGVGEPMLDAILSRFFVEHRADVAKIASGTPTVEVDLAPIPEPTEEEIAIVLRDATSNFEPRTPDTIEAWIRRNYHCVDWFPRATREHLRFNAVFLPADPLRWPDVTVEATRFLNLGDPRDVVAYDLGVFRDRAARSGEPLVPEQSMWWPLYRAAAQSTWLARWNARTALHGLPCDRVLSVDLQGDGVADWELRTADAWAEVAAGIDPCEVSIARRWLAALQAMRDQLDRDGVSTEPRPAAKTIGELEARAHSNGSRVDHRKYARGLGFPSALAYHEYRGLEASFRALLERDLAQDPPGRWGAVYVAHGARAAATDPILGGDTTAEVLLVAAFDSRMELWKNDGWRWAATRAKAIRPEVKASESNPSAWSELVTEHSELWEAPPAMCIGPVRVGGPKRPRRALWMGLDQALQESAYTRIASGISIADHARHEQAVGTVDGPFRGPHGYYFVRVLERKPARRALSPTDTSGLQRIRDECIRLTMLDYAREALAAADTQGLEDE